jgi:hypothetical protein
MRATSEDACGSGEISNCHQDILPDAQREFESLFGHDKNDDLASLEAILFSINQNGVRNGYASRGTWGFMIFYLVDTV